MYIVPDSELVKEIYNERVAEAQRLFGVRNGVEKKNLSLRVRVARLLRTGLVTLGLR
jgi:hypothetical protein